MATADQLNANFPQGLVVIPPGTSTPTFAVDKAGNVYSAGNFNAQDITFDDVVVDQLTVGGASTFASTVGITGLLSLSAGMNLGTAQAIDATTSININEAGADVDVRIESDTNASHFISDAGVFAGVGAISIGRSASLLTSYVSIQTPAISATANQNFFSFNIAPFNSVTVPTGTAAVVASASFNEPQITATGTVSDAYTVYIADAPTEGTRNGAFWVASGTSRFDALIDAKSLNAAIVLKAFSDSPYTVAATDFTILGNAVGGAITVTLPAASAGTRILNVKKIDATANAVTIARAGSDTIDGATSLVLATQYQSAQIQSNGVNGWVVL